MSQEPGDWLTTFLLNYGFSRVSDDKTLYLKRTDSELFVLLIYVDDIVFECSSEDMCNKFSNLMSSEFEMCLLDGLKNFLRQQIIQMSNGIFVSQIKYAKNLIKRFGLDATKHTKTPISTSLRLTRDGIGIPIEYTLYCSLINSFLYSTTSRLDISVSLGVYAQFQANPKLFHLNAIKHIIEYISGTCEYSLWHSFDSNTGIIVFYDTEKTYKADVLL